MIMRLVDPVQHVHDFVVHAGKVPQMADAEILLARFPNFQLTISARLP